MALRIVGIDTPAVGAQLGLPGNNNLKLPDTTAGDLQAGGEAIARTLQIQQDTAALERETSQRQFEAKQARGGGLAEAFKALTSAADFALKADEQFKTKRDEKLGSELQLEYQKLLTDARRRILDEGNKFGTTVLRQEGEQILSRPEFLQLRPEARARITRDYFASVQQIDDEQGAALRDRLQEQNKSTIAQQTVEVKRKLVPTLSRLENDRFLTEEQTGEILSEVDGMIELGVAELVKKGVPEYQAVLTMAGVLDQVVKSQATGKVQRDQTADKVRAYAAYATGIQEIDASGLPLQDKENSKSTLRQALGITGDAPPAFDQQAVLEREFRNTQMHDQMIASAAKRAGVDPDAPADISGVAPQLQGALAASAGTATKEGWARQCQGKYASTPMCRAGEEIWRAEEEYGNINKSLQKVATDKSSLDREYAAKMKTLETAVQSRQRWQAAAQQWQNATDEQKKQLVPPGTNPEFSEKDIAQLQEDLRVIGAERNVLQQQLSGLQNSQAEVNNRLKETFNAELKGGRIQFDENIKEAAAAELAERRRQPSPSQPTGGQQASTGGVVMGARDTTSGRYVPVRQKTWDQLSKSGHRMTSPRGMRQHPAHGGMRLHQGEDWSMPTGTELISMEGGKVTEVGFEKGYGNYVVIVTDSGFELQYNHLQAPKVTVGQRVSPDQTVALSGSTGVSTGPHLDFEVRQKPGRENLTTDASVYYEHLKKLAKEPAMVGTPKAVPGTGPSPRAIPSGQVSSGQIVYSRASASMQAATAIDTPPANAVPLSGGAYIHGGKIYWPKAQAEAINSYGGGEPLGVLNVPQAGEQPMNSTVQFQGTPAYGSLQPPMTNGKVSTSVNDYLQNGKLPRNNPNDNYGYPALQNDAAARKALAEVADEFGMPAVWLADLIGHETDGTWDTGIVNHIGATGLIQFIEDGGLAVLAQHYGISQMQAQAMLKRQSIAEQLRGPVRVYLQQYGTKFKSVEDLAAAVLGSFNMLDTNVASRPGIPGSGPQYVKYLNGMGRHVGRSYSHYFARR